MILLGRLDRDGFAAEEANLEVTRMLGNWCDLAILTVAGPGR